MPRKRETEVYGFDELSKEARGRAIDDWKHKGRAFDSDDADILTEHFKEVLEEKGFPSGDVRWRLGGSQGDGVAFYGPVDLMAYHGFRRGKLGPKDWSPKGKPSGTLATLSDKVTMRIEKSRSFGMYDHWNTMLLETQVHDDLTPAEESLLREVEARLKEDIKRASKELERDGHEEIDYREGDEQIAESIRAGEHEFDEGGKML